ncbi:MAG TPA: hypothetical protein VFS92_07070 [Planctomycetota bacterium]|nr:hypothetical protein [Planctomycetota bacterium]
MKAPATVLLLAAAAAAAEGDPPPPPAPPQPAGDPAPPASSDGELGALADAVAKEVEALRGLRFKTPVARRTKAREAVVDEFRPKRRRPSKGPSGQSRALRFFGYIEAEKPSAPGQPETLPDAAETEARFRAESVGGYYSSRDKVFTLVDGDGGSLNRMIVFHELIHALEDQHYDFRATEKPLRDADRTDRWRAYRALVEGSAQLHTDRWVDGEPGRRKEIFQDILLRRGRTPPKPKDEAKPADPPAGQPAGPQAEKPAEGEAAPPKPRAPKPPSAPPVYLAIREQMFPYHNGRLFLEAVLGADDPPLEGVDPLARLFAAPPASSEQVLHPEKYLDPPDLPREIVLPDLAPILGEGWEHVAEDTEGELGLGIALNRWLYGKLASRQFLAVLKPPPDGFKKPEDLMNTAVEFRGTSGASTNGWDGDRWALWVNGDRECMAWVLVFDSERDAAECAEGFAKAFKHKYKGAVRGEDGVWTGAGEGSTAVVAAGDRLVVVERCPPEALPKVLDALRAAVVERDPRDAIPAPPPPAEAK